MLRTHSLTFQYPSAAAIDFPDIDIPQGGALLLRGSSGSGKSPLLAVDFSHPVRAALAWRVASRSNSARVSVMRGVAALSDFCPNACT
jgi:ABC-type dipeptide/oligopeptide/nickel transport system ATPase subunit